MKAKLTLSIMLLSLFFIYNEETIAQTPNWLWAKSAGGSGYDYTTSVTSDALGNLIVTGSFESATIIFGPTTLTNANPGYTDMYIVKYDNTGTVLWAKSAGGNANDFSYSVILDAIGNIIVAGGFTSPAITFGSTTLTNTGDYDVFIAKYDQMGTLLWAQSAGGSIDDRASSVTSDAAGNLLVAGYFKSPTITFGSTTLTNVGAYDMFIVKYDQTGTVLWAKSEGGNGSDYANSISSDASDNIIVAGVFFSPTITFGSNTLTNVSQAGDDDMYIVKYDPSGIVLWAKSAGGSDLDYANSVTTDSSANLIVTGAFGSTTITFGAISLTNAGTGDMFIVKYDSAGIVLWAKTAGGNDNEVANSVTADASGNIIVAGSFTSSSISFDSIVLTNSNIGYADMFIVKYDQLGTVVWAKSAGGSSHDEAVSVTADILGNLMVSGYFYSPILSFGPTTLMNAGADDIFIAKLSSITGLQNVTFINNLYIYPNPSINYFTIDLVSTNKRTEITITDITGKIMYTTTITDSQKTEVNSKDYAAGVYLVKIQTGDFIETKKLIVAK